MKRIKIEKQYNIDIIDPEHMDQTISKINYEIGNEFSQEFSEYCPIDLKHDYASDKFNAVIDVRMFNKVDFDFMMKYLEDFITAHPKVKQNELFNKFYQCLSE